ATPRRGPGRAAVTSASPAPSRHAPEPFSLAKARKSRRGRASTYRLPPAVSERPDHSSWPSSPVILLQARAARYVPPASMRSRTRKTSSSAWPPGSSTSIRRSPPNSESSSKENKSSSDAPNNASSGAPKSPSSVTGTGSSAAYAMPAAAAAHASRTTTKAPAPTAVRPGAAAGTRPRRRTRPDVVSTSRTSPHPSAARGPRQRTAARTTPQQTPARTTPQQTPARRRRHHKPPALPLAWPRRSRSAGGPLHERLGEHRVGQIAQRNLLQRHLGLPALHQLVDEQHHPRDHFVAHPGVVR